MDEIYAMQSDVRENAATDIIGEYLSKEEQLLFMFNRQVAHCISTRRKEKGMTQEELADISGVSRATISAIEKRRRLVSTEIMLKLLDALGLSIKFV